MNRSSPSFWRFHNKPRSQRSQLKSAAAPRPGSVEHIRLVIKQTLAAADVAGLPRPIFSFAPGDVETVFTYKRDFGAGLWFALKDGRVINGDGEAETANRAVYTDPINDDDPAAS